MMENAFKEHLEGTAQCYMIAVSSIQSLIRREWPLQSNWALIG